MQYRFSIILFSLLFLAAPLMGKVKHHAPDEDKSHQAPVEENGHGNSHQGHDNHYGHDSHHGTLDDSHGDGHGDHGHHPDNVTGEVIMHHIQDNEVFEIFNPLNPLHPAMVSLSLTWKDISPKLAGYLGWVFNGKEVLNDENQLFFTKQSIMMLLAAVLIILFFTVGYKKNRKVQSGFGNLMEVFVVFIRDEVVYPNMGEKQGRRFLPLILTLFFFIVTLNLLGLVPGSSTSTASWSVTVGLALITFFTYILFGNKDFWKHIFATPGVPAWLLPIMIPVELIGLLTKPFALSVRLLANMNAGHIIILAFLGIIINVKSYWVALGSVPMALAINMLEIFVAFLQGYIFSLLSSIFIGMAVVEHEHH